MDSQSDNLAFADAYRWDVYVLILGKAEDFSEFVSKYASEASIRSAMVGQRVSIRTGAQWLSETLRRECQGVAIYIPIANGESFVLSGTREGETVVGFSLPAGAPDTAIQLLRSLVSNLSPDLAVIASEQLPPSSRTEFEDLLNICTQTFTPRGYRKGLWL